MYIRTKDNLYEITDKQYDILCGNLTEEEKENYKNITSFGLGSIEEGSYESVLIKDILEYSENLQELCDLFIDEETKTIFHKHNGYVINWKTNMFYSLKELSESYHSVKGAIYTDEGLIYVAKMDNEGKLVLI